MLTCRHVAIDQRIGQATYADNLCAGSREGDMMTAFTAGRFVIIRIGATWLPAAACLSLDKLQQERGASKSQPGLFFAFCAAQPPFPLPSPSIVHRLTLPQATVILIGPYSEKAKAMMNVLHLQAIPITILGYAYLPVQQLHLHIPG